MVSKASEDLPEPESPVNTTSWSRGISRSTFLRLCSRAPRIAITRVPSGAVWRRGRLLSKRSFMRSVGAARSAKAKRTSSTFARGLSERSENGGLFASVLFSTFVSSRGTRFYERRKQRDTTQVMILVWLCI